MKSSTPCFSTAKSRLSRDHLAIVSKQVSSLLSLAASLEKHSEHPLGEAIVKKAEEEKLTLSKVEKFKATTGKGVEGQLRIKNLELRIILGNRKLIKNFDVSIHRNTYEKLENEGKTVVFLAIKNYKLQTNRPDCHC